MGCISLAENQLLAGLIPTWIDSHVSHHDRTDTDVRNRSKANWCHVGSKSVCPRGGRVIASSASANSARIRRPLKSVIEPRDSEVSHSTELNPIVGGELMDILDRNGRRLGWSNRIVRGGNRGRLQEILEAGRPEHEQIVILADPGIAQLVGDVARRDERIASPENEDLAADNNFELSREDIVSLVLSRVNVTRHAYSRRKAHLHQTDGTDAHV